MCRRPRSVAAPTASPKFVTLVSASPSPVRERSTRPRAASPAYSGPLVLASAGVKTWRAAHFSGPVGLLGWRATTGCGPKTQVAAAPTKSSPTRRTVDSAALGAAAPPDGPATSTYVVLVHLPRTPQLDVELARDATVLGRLRAVPPGNRLRCEQFRTLAFISEASRVGDRAQSDRRQPAWRPPARPTRRCGSDRRERRRARWRLDPASPARLWCAPSCR